MLKSLKKLVIKEYQLDETEKLIKDIVIGMLGNENTEAITAPLSGMYFLSNKELHYYIRINEFSVTITNHKFMFREGMSSKFGNMIISIVKEFMEKNRMEFENRVFINQIQLLKNIKNSL
jgi:hypothetical protein